MASRVRVRATPAIFPGDNSVVESSRIVRRVEVQTFPDNSVAESGDWFVKAVRTLLSDDKPGTELDCITGFVFGERNCQRYAAGHVKVTVPFLQVLFSKPQGEPFFDAWMAEIGAPWWAPRERARRVGEAALRAAEHRP